MHHWGLRGSMLPTFCDPLPSYKVGCRTWGFRHDGSGNWRCRDKGGGGGKGRRRTRNQGGWWLMEAHCSELEGKREVESSVHGGVGKRARQICPAQSKTQGQTEKVKTEIQFNLTGNQGQLRANQTLRTCSIPLCIQMKTHYVARSLFWLLFLSVATTSSLSVIPSSENLKHITSPTPSFSFLKAKYTA